MGASLALALSVLGAAGFMAPAQAMSLREFAALEQSDPKTGEAFANYYLVGALESALEINAFHVRSGAKPLFCLNGRRLVPSMARSLYATELQRNSGLYEADMGVPLVLTNALTTVYPCE
jgi:hypothetical protein